MEKLVNIDDKVAAVCDKLNIMIDDHRKLNDLSLKYRSGGKILSSAQTMNLSRFLLILYTAHIIFLCSYR